MSQELQDLKGQILGTSNINGETRKIKTDNDGIIYNKPMQIKGVASSGTASTLIDLTKNFQADILNGKTININIDGTEYFRKITGSIGNNISFSPIQEGVAASAVIGDVSGGQITITCATAGVDGNNYTVEFISAEGNSQPTTAVLEGTVLTVTLGTGETGEVNATGMDTASAIDELPEFIAQMTGAGGIPVPTVEPIPFAGGIDGISIANGTEYIVEIFKPVTEMALFGKTLSDRPDPTAVKIGTTFTLVNATLDTWMSDGTDWVVI